MADENKIRDAADAVKGIVEAVPIYQDVLQPAAKEIGTGLQTVAKLVHVALSPVSAVVWGYDKIKDYLQETLTEKLKNVPPENIVPPKITIAGPIVEQLRFAADEPHLRELYASLLAASMDAAFSQYAHPAFIEVIRQLATDEARIIHFLAYSSSNVTLLTDGILRIGFAEDEKQKLTGRFFETRVNLKNTLGVAAGCSHLDLLESYLDNLRRLGLVQTRELVTYSGYADLLNRDTPESVFPTIQHFIEEHADPAEELEISFHGTEGIISFTAFGEQFCRACVFPLTD